MTALDTNSKGDTELLVKGPGAANLITDLSKHRDNLTNNTTYVSEAASDRTALAAPREVAIVVDLRSGDTAYLLEHGTGDGVNFSYQVEIFGTTIKCNEDGTMRVSAVMPGLGVGAKKCLIAWSVRPEGASVRSELALYNFDTDEWAIAVATHAETTTDPAWSLVINGDGAGASGLADIGDFYSVRIGRRFHATTEAKEDWVGLTTPPDLDQRRRTPLLPLAPPLPVEGEFSGPVYGQALVNTRSVELRGVGCLVNMRPTAPFTETNAYDPPHFYREPFDTNLLKFCLRYFRHVIVPGKCNKARVRIHVQQWKTEAGGEDQCTLYFRCYSMAYFKLFGAPPKPIVFTRTEAASINENHTSTGVGEWIDLGELSLSKEPDGLTYLALAFSFDNDTGGADQDNTSFRIKAWTVEPFRDDSGLNGDDGFDFGNG